MPHDSHNSDLPDDLALLGQQLHDDAERLAGLFPPPACRAAALAAPNILPARTSRRWPWAVSAAALLLAAGGAWWQLRGVPDTSPEVAVVAVDAPSREKETPTPAERTDFPLEKAEFVRELSGPELEGVIDLLEPSHSQGTNLAI